MPSGVYERKKRQRKPCKNHPGSLAVAKGLCESCYKKEARKNPNFRQPRRTREQLRRYHLAKYSGMTIAEYEELYKSQGGVCEICGQPETAMGRHGEVRLLCVDHDHKTGVVRSLLCASCNIALGNFKDDIAIIQSAFEYLIEHSQTQKGL